MGKKSRDKGSRFELFLEHALKVCFPDAEHMGTRIQGRNPKYADIEGTPFRIEAKHWATMSYRTILNALKQAEENGLRFGDTRVPIAITKIDRTQPIVHLTLRHFLQLVEKHFWREPDLAEVIPIRLPPEPPEPSTDPEVA